MNINKILILFITNLFLLGRLLWNQKQREKHHQKKGSYQFHLKKRKKIPQKNLFNHHQLNHPLLDHFKLKNLVNHKGKNIILLLLFHFSVNFSGFYSRSESLSRQSTQESDSETTVSTGEPIRKSPREFIIPIAVEGGGYVTPRAGSLEPSETASTTSTLTNRSSSKFSRARRMK